jgi:hypothetical protein
VFLSFLRKALLGEDPKNPKRSSDGKEGAAGIHAAGSRVRIPHHGGDMRGPTFGFSCVTIYFPAVVNSAISIDVSNVNSLPHDNHFAPQRFGPMVPQALDCSLPSFQNV